MTLRETVDSQFSTEPPPVKWPWEVKPPTPWFVAACICEDGWLPEPQGETMIACHVCNVETPQ